MSHDIEHHERELALARQRTLDLREHLVVWRGRCGVCAISVSQPPQERPHRRLPDDAKLTRAQRASRTRNIA
jgi:hypothetical protein